MQIKILMHNLSDGRRTGWQQCIETGLQSFSNIYLHDKQHEQNVR